MNTDLCVFNSFKIFIITFGFICTLSDKGFPLASLIEQELLYSIGPELPLGALKVISEKKLDLGQSLFTCENPKSVFQSFIAFTLALIWCLKR